MAFRVFTRVLSAATLFLILAGAMVTSTGSGLSVPDWPTSYGYNMFTFPLHLMVGGIIFEHGHRLVASAVGFFTIVLAAWLWWRDDRRWLRWFGVAALGVVIVQGVLGGLTVIYLLPEAISIGHAGLAQVFFCMMIAISVFTSKGWMDNRGVGAADDRRLRRIAMWTVAVVYVQILLGAAMRHTASGLAIPDFPLVFGGLVPPQWDPKVAIHFAHRVGAAAAAVMIAWLVMHIRARHAGNRWLTRPAGMLALLAIAQVTLGAYVIWTARDIYINSAHVMTGALVLAASVVVALRAHRGRFGRVAARGEATGRRAEVAA
jgi:cytochrome c oxidase assembly protein subunit 15